MLKTCPDCQIEVTVDEESAETCSCPGCGLLLYSRSRESDALLVKRGVAVELSVADLERTRQYHASLEEILPTPDQLPRRLGRYELVELLGEGSFAQVYRAVDSELGRDVAIKIPRKQRFTSSDQIARFVDEARTAAKLEHPGIVRIYDIGWLSDDVCFIAMEHCSGGSLDNLLKAGTDLSFERTAEILAEAAEAIHFAHLKGLIHRDLKPSNIMFGRDGRTRIVDFGLALPEDQQRDRAGEFAGTLPYMSPEQIRRETHHLDGRTDIWSLGIILYQMLTGRRPFAGNQQQLSAEILKRDPKPLRQVVQDVPKELEEICLKCLAKSVTGRWATAQDISDALKTWIETRHSTITGLAAQAQPVLQSAPPRRTISVGMSFAILVLVVVPLGVFAAMTLAPKREAPVLPRVVISLDDEPLNRAVPLITQDRIPTKLCWPNSGLDDSFDLGLAEGRLSLQNRSVGFVRLGETTSDHVVFEAEITRTGDYCINGFFWGWQSDLNYANQCCCFDVVLTSVPGPNGRPVHHLSVEWLRLRNDRGTYYSIMETIGLAAADLEDELNPNRGRLTIIVRNRGGLEAVLWNGNELKGLPKEAHAFLKFQPKRFPAMRSSGGFGVLNRRGAILVRNPTIKILERGNLNARATNDPIIPSL